MENQSSELVSVMTETKRRNSVIFWHEDIHIGTRRTCVSPSTANSKSKWVAQQGRNFLMHAEYIGLSPELLMHDRDTKFTKEFDEVILSTDCEIKKTSILSPKLQTHVERVVQTLKHELLN